MGLSNACASQSPRSILASKHIKEDDIWCNEINFDFFLKQRDVKFPETYKLKDEIIKTNLRISDSGTAVLWRDCDNLDKKRTSTLHRHIVDMVSITYRHFLNAGRKIYVNGKPVELFDPLCRLKNHRFRESYGISKLYGEPIVIPIEYEDDNGEKVTSKVVVDIVLLDMNKIVDTEGLHSGLKIGMRTQGLYLVRNNRGFESPQWFGAATQKFDHLNYIRGEIRFDSVLDKLFGIGHNKSRAYPKDDILDGIVKEVAPRITQAFAEHKRTRKQRKESKLGGSEHAKRIHTEATSFLIPEEKLQLSEKAVKEKPKEIRTLKEEEEKLIQQIERNPLIDPQVKASRSKIVKEVLESKYTSGIIIVNDGPSAPMFRVEYAEGKRLILLNSDHNFYEYVYEVAADSGYFHPLIDLIFYAFSDVREELGDEKYRLIFDEVIKRFSNRYGAYLNTKEVAEVLATLKDF